MGETGTGLRRILTAIAAGAVIRGPMSYPFGRILLDRDGPSKGDSDRPPPAGPPQYCRDIEPISGNVRNGCSAVRIRREYGDVSRRLSALPRLVP